VQKPGDGKDKNVLQLWKEKASSRKLSGQQEVQPLWQEGSCGKGLLGEACRQEAKAEGQVSMRRIRNPLAGVVVEEGLEDVVEGNKFRGVEMWFAAGALQSRRDEAPLRLISWLSFELELRVRALIDGLMTQLSTCNCC